MDPLDRKDNKLIGFNDDSNFWKAKLESFIYGLESSTLLNNSSLQPSLASQLKDLLDLNYIDDSAKVADQWAKGADLLNLDHIDMDPSTSIDFIKTPNLVHPLSGNIFNLTDDPNYGEYFKDNNHVLNESLLQNIVEHFKNLIIKDNSNKIDFKYTFFSFWRFASQLPDISAVSTLWENIPADVQIPDRSIWSHISLSSSLSGLFKQNEDPGLFSFSLSPVQPFIEQARSMSDLWAGSHLLATIALQALSVVVENFGPDAIILPSLRGISQFDFWLDNYFRQHDIDDQWKKISQNISSQFLSDANTDSSPILYASLPNRFTAIIPFAQAEDITQEISKSIHNFLKDCGEKVLTKLSQKCGGSLGNHWQDQMSRHLQDFPQIATSAVKWPKWDPKNPNWIDDPSLKKLMDLAKRLDKNQNFFSTDLWKEVLSKDLQIEGKSFYSSHPGVLYTPVFHATEAFRNSSKAAQTFSPSVEKGYKCSICGEREWLSDLAHCTIDGKNRSAVQLSPGDRKKALFSNDEASPRKGTIWTRLHKRRPSLAKEGEHLCGRCSLKRFWTEIVIDDIKESAKSSVTRYNISTHTMALSRMIKDIIQLEDIDHQQLLKELIDYEKQITQALEQSLDQDNSERHDHSAKNTALPKKIHKELKRFDNNLDLKRRISQIPHLIEQRRDLGTNGRDIKVGQLLKKINLDQPQNYYAMIKFDGDSMGTWLSSMDRTTSFEKTWHSDLGEYQTELKRKSPNASKYLTTNRPPSPSRHIAISEALTAFASLGVPHVVENMFSGNLIYAGGDDVLAMVPVEEVLPISLFLRSIYSGAKTSKSASFDDTLKVSNGWLHIEKYGPKMTMGPKATASAGIVVAHYSTPIAYVLNLLRKAEHEAKQSGRNALSIHILNRSGSRDPLIVHFLTPDEQSSEQNGLDKYCSVDLLTEFIDQAQNLGLSRGSYYSAQNWLRDLPPSLSPSIYGDKPDDNWKTMVSQVLFYRFCRQSSNCEESNSKYLKELLPLIIEKAVSGHLASSVYEKANGKDVMPPSNTDEVINSLVGFFATAEFFGARHGQ